MHKLVQYFFIVILFFFSTFLSANEAFESQSNFLSKRKSLIKTQQKKELQLLFNKAVMHLQKEQYQEAIDFFEKTKQIMPLASELNQGVAYYKLNDINRSQALFTKIIQDEEALFNNTYIYMSANLYLYKITNDKSYLEETFSSVKKRKNLDIYSKKSSCRYFNIYEIL